ncbi:M14 family metallopeptidase [Aquimarina megaterium]|uniref:M14 family metallopeptidase n=1 Tax=Aquimarina megaterium TaxID=1443666 RepID=UPI00046F2A54|nr:M14 family metallopeptidase [Aquimarina megaterium]
MKKENRYSQKTILLIAIFIAAAISSCVGPKKVNFPEKVDTRNRKISYQSKKTYTSKDTRVWISNTFDGGRVNGVEVINDNTVVVDIEPENIPINKSPYYAFKIWSDTIQQRYVQFRYPHGFAHRYVPKIFDGKIWHNADTTSFLVRDTIATLKLKVNKIPQIIAAQELHTSKEVEQWYQKTIVDNNTTVQLKSVGLSVLGRNIPVLDIYNGDPQNRDIIVLLTRQHPPEVTGYFAFQHFLETIVKKSSVTEAFLDKYRVLAFPIVNPDGVDLGHWRHNANGVDTNRDWSKYRQPEVKQIVQYINEVARLHKSKIVLGLDFHSTYEDVFYTNAERENTHLPHFIEDWFTTLEDEIPGYTVNEASNNSKKPVSKGWFLYGHQATGITYEIGDETPKERIKQIGIISANAMMKLLLNKNIKVE